MLPKPAPLPPPSSLRVAAVAGLAACVLLFLGLIADSVFSGPGTGFQAPKTVAVQGTVLYQGKPLDGVRVTLHPQFDMGPVKFCPSGISDAQGRFTLSTGARDDALRPGTTSSRFVGLAATMTKTATSGEAGSITPPAANGG